MILPTKTCPKCSGKGEIFDPESPLPTEYNSDGTLKHIYADGSRYHVIRYLSTGMSCSEVNCEINGRGEK